MVVLDEGRGKHLRNATVTFPILPGRFCMAQTPYPGRASEIQDTVIQRDRRFFARRKAMACLLLCSVWERLRAVTTGSRVLQVRGIST